MLRAASCLSEHSFVKAPAVVKRTAKVGGSFDLANAAPHAGVFLRHLAFLITMTLKTLENPGARKVAEAQ